MMPTTEIHKGFSCFLAPDLSSWREWLIEHHQSENSVWLILYKKSSGKRMFGISEAINEALCFGWVDSKSNKRDDDSYYVYFSKRNPKSNWSKINKEKVEKLISEDRFSEAGYKMVTIAKQTGTWDALNDVDNLVVPDDLMNLFDLEPIAYSHWLAFPDSTKRGILEWIFNAKRATTRLKRIQETVSKAKMNIRANQYNG